MTTFAEKLQSQRTWALTSVNPDSIREATDRVVVAADGLGVQVGDNALCVIADLVDEVVNGENADAELVAHARRVLEACQRAEWLISRALTAWLPGGDGAATLIRRGVAELTCSARLASALALLDMGEITGAAREVTA